MELGPVGSRGPRTRKAPGSPAPRAPQDRSQPLTARGPLWLQRPDCVKPGKWGGRGALKEVLRKGGQTRAPRREPRAAVLSARPSTDVLQFPEAGTDRQTRPTEKPEFRKVTGQRWVPTGRWPSPKEYWSEPRDLAGTGVEASWAPRGHGLEYSGDKSHVPARFQQARSAGQSCQKSPRRCQGTSGRT